MQDLPTAKVLLSVFRESWNPDELSEILGCLPTFVQRQGEHGAHSKNIYEGSSWNYRTALYHTWHAEDAINGLMSDTKPWLAKLIQTAKENNLGILVHIQCSTNTQVVLPSIVLRREFLRLVVALNAEIEIDCLT